MDDWFRPDLIPVFDIGIVPVGRRMTLEEAGQ
jgi:hypothetical protein